MCIYNISRYRDKQRASVCLSVAGASAASMLVQDEPTPTHAARTTASATGCSNDAKNLPIFVSALSHHAPLSLSCVAFWR